MTHRFCVDEDLKPAERILLVVAESQLTWKGKNLKN